MARRKSRSPSRPRSRRASKADREELIAFGKIVGTILIIPLLAAAWLEQWRLAYSRDANSAYAHRIRDPMLVLRGVAMTGLFAILAAWGIPTLLL